MKKKILALVLCLVLALTAITGTLAYFTDTENVTNTFTVGSVDIQLLESQLYPQVDGSTWEQIEADAAQYEDYLKEQGKDLVPGKEVMKAVYVKNTGKNDAYVRVRIQLPEDVAARVQYMFNSTHITINEDITMKTNALSDGTLEATFTYVEAIEATGHTEWSPVWKFWLNKDLDNEDFNDLDLGSIKVFADAIQAEGFDSAEAAFAAFDGQEVGDKVENNTKYPDESDTVFTAGE